MKIILSLFFLGICTAILFSGCLPTPQPYPYQDPATVKEKGQTFSDNLTAYIKDWKAGKVSDIIPASVLPEGTYINEMDPNKPHPNYKDIRLVNPDTIAMEKYWVVRKAELIDRNALKGLFPDPHYTYLWAMYLMPFESKAIIKGKFPKCRYFQFTPTPPLNGLQYNWFAFGPNEVPIVDVDIEPDPGSINPFRLNANRNATNRNYTVTFVSKIGDQATFNAQYCPKPPYYRGTGNTRYTGAMVFRGPGTSGPADGKNCYWGPGTLWGRYCEPDKYGKPGFDSFGGAGLPKVYYQLPTGEQYLITCDMNQLYGELVKSSQELVQNADPADAEFEGKAWGWEKMWGIGNAVIQGFLRDYGFKSDSDKKWCKDFIKGIEGKGVDVVAPGNWEGSATCVNTCNYFTRRAKVADGKCMVLTGKLPTFPKTRDGQSTMTGGQMRYWSICMNEDDIDMSGSANPRQGGICTGTVCDHEIVLDSERRYVICFSKKADKPLNATSANGVTWVEWGANSKTHWTLRWISVYPDWSFSYHPHENVLTQAKTDWPEPGFDKTLVSENKRTGWLKEYLPVTNYMSKTCFQNMGSPVTWAKVDAVAWDCCGRPINNNGTMPGVVFIPLIVMSLLGLISQVFRKK